MASPIAEFLASVGFKADEKSLKTAMARVAAFGVAIKAAALGIASGITRVAEGEAALAKTAAELRTSADRLEELGYVAEQSGESLDAVTRSMAGLLAKNPGIKDTAKALDEAGKRMRGMSEDAAKLYAAKMGIDPALVPALRSDVSGLKDEFRQMYAVAGRDAAAAGEASKGFLAELAKLKTLAGMLAKSVAMAFIGRIRRDIESLRRTVMENFGGIKAILEGVISVVLRVSGVISALVHRAVKTVAGVVNWFGKLDQGARKLIIGAGLLLAAWKLLNAGFLATPLGMVVMGLAAIVGLIDDYLTYMEGGESKFDWGPWEETIEGCRAAVTGVVRAVGDFIGRNRELVKGLVKAGGLLLVFTKIGRPIMALGRALLGAARAGGALSGGIGLASKAVKVLWGLVKANPLGIILTAATLIYQYWGPISGFFKDLWAKVEASFPNFAAYITSWVQAFKAFGKMVMALLSGDFTAAGEQAKAIFDGAVDAVKAAFTGLGNAIVGIFDAAWAGVSDVFPDFAAWAEDAAASLRNILGKAIAWVKEKLAALLDYLPDFVKEKLGISVAAEAKEAGGGQADAPAAVPEQLKPPKRLVSPAAQSAPAAGASGGKAAADPEAEFERLQENTGPTSRNAPAEPDPEDEFERLLQNTGRTTRAPVQSAPPAAQAAQAAMQAAQPLGTPALTPSAGGGEQTTQNITIESNTQITVNGSGDPQQAGNAVAGAQNNVNAALVRNAKGAAR